MFHKDTLIMDQVLRRVRKKAKDPVKAAFDRISKLEAKVPVGGGKMLSAKMDLKEKKMASGKKKWTCSITFRLSGVPGKTKKEALENFRKWIGNQLRDSTSSIRKKFFKMATATEEGVSKG